MEVLPFSSESDEFLKLQFECVSLEDIEFIQGGKRLIPRANSASSFDVFGRNDLVTVKANGFTDRYSKASRNRVYSFTQHKTRKKVELEYIVSLESRCVKNTLYWDGEIIDVVASIDGLYVSEQKHNTVIQAWVYLDECDDSDNVLESLRNKHLGNIAKPLLMQLEHVMLASNAKILFVTAGGNQEPTNTVIYKSSATLKMSLLNDYAKFQRDVNQRRKTQEKERNT